MRGWSFGDTWNLPAPVFNAAVTFVKRVLDKRSSDIDDLE